MEYIDILRSRYATKKFDGKKIPQEKVDELIEMIRLSPSSRNIQPWKIKIIEDQETKDMLKPLANNQAQIDTCSHLLVFCADIDFVKLGEDLGKLMEENGAPSERVAMLISRIKETKGNKDRDTIAYAQHQVYIALTNALNGAKALGFDSCPMGGFDKEGFAEALELPDTLVPTVLCPIGYAADEPRKKIRFSRDQIII